MDGRPLLRVLELARRRLLLRQWLRNCVASLAIVVVVLSITRAAVANGLVTWLPSTTLDPLAPALVFGAAVALLASGLWTLMVAPDLKQVARAVDVATGHDPLIVTGLEMIEKPPNPSLPRRALLEEVFSVVGALDQREAAPIDVPRNWWVLPIAVLVAVAATVGPGQLSFLTPLAEQATDDVVFEEAIADVLLLADILSDSPEDSALHELSAQFRRLASEMEESGLIDASVRERLSEALLAVAEAAESGQDGISSQVRDAFDDLPIDQTRSRSEDRPFSFGRQEVPQSTSVERGQDTPTVQSDAFDPSSVFRTLGQVAAALDRDRREPAATVAGPGEDRGGAQLSGSSSYYTDWNEEMAESLAAKRAAIRQRGTGDAAAGEALQSDDAPGDAAGHGTQPVDSGAAETDASLLDLATEQMLLAADPRADGRTTTYMPEPRWEEDRVVRDAPRLPPLLHGLEDPVDVDIVRAAHVRSVATFFERQAGTHDISYMEEF